MIFVINLLYCELVIFVFNLLYCELWICGLCDICKFCCIVNLLYWDIFIFIWLPIVIKVPTGTDVFFVPNFRFRCFRNTDIVSVSEVTVFDFVSDKKYENSNGFSVYRPFPTVFIPSEHNHHFWNDCHREESSYWMMNLDRKGPPCSKLFIMAKPSPTRLKSPSLFWIVFLINHLINIGKEKSKHCQIPASYMIQWTMCPFHAQPSFSPWHVLFWLYPFFNFLLKI